MTNEHEQRLHEQLCAYVLGECTNDERLEIERELMRSPELRAQRDTIERTVGLVKSAMSDGEALSPEATATVFSAASTSKPSAWQAVPWMRMAAGIGAVALGVALVRNSVQHPETEIARVSGSDLRRESEMPAPSGSTRAASVERRMGDDLSSAFGVDRDAGESKKKADEQGSLLSESAKKLDDSSRLRADPVDSLKGAAPALEAKGENAPVLVGATRAGKDANVAPGFVSGPSDGASKFKEGALKTYRAPGDSTPPGGREGGSGGTGPVQLGQAQDAKPTASSQDFFLGMEAADSSTEKSAALDDATARWARPKLDAPGEKSVQVAGKPVAGPSTGGPSSPVTPDASVISLGSSGKKDASQEELAKKRQSERSAGKRPAKPTAPSGGVVSNEEALELTEDLDRDEERLYYKLPVVEQQAYLDRECRRILDDCVRRPNERPRDMYFRFWGDNPFEVAALDPLSTFSADVDTASYTLARRFLNEGNVPGKAQIRTEEFVNYFKSDVPAPTSGVFAIQTNLTPSRFSTDTTRQMMRVVVRGKDMSKVERNRLNLTFVVDVSGSMREQNRLEMVKHSMRLLATQLNAYDKIGIVKFSTDASTVLPLTSVADRAKIESAIEPLQPEGSTNSNAGLELGYAIALAGLDPEATNRVVFLSDGVANVGITDPAVIAEHVKPMREKGIYLNTIGVGMNNHNDVLLEQLADKADGVCNYIDSPDEAKRALVDNFTGAFQPIARDVKIQVEFDPAQVLRYRLLGYENRAIADADFRNDKVDAGELGAGHQVTALYEIERQAAKPQGDTSEIRPFATVRVRWKEPRNFGKSAEQDKAGEIAHTVSGVATTFEAAGQSYRKSVLAAQFAEILRRSIHARGDSLDDLLNESLKLQKEIPTDTDFSEFVQLVSKSKDLILRTMPACDELCQAIDSVRETYYRRAQLEQLQRDMDQKTVDELKRQNDELEARLRDIVRRRLESQGR